MSKKFLVKIEDSGVQKLGLPNCERIRTHLLVQFLFYTNSQTTKFTDTSM
jgi:hypothetical protein